MSGLRKRGVVHSERRKTGTKRKVRYLKWCLHIPNLFLPGRTGHKIIFWRKKAGLNTLFFLLDWLPHKAKEPYLPLYLPIGGRRTDGLMQSTTFKNRTRIANFISYDDNCYTKYSHLSNASYVCPCAKLTQLEWLAKSAKVVSGVIVTGYFCPCAKLKQLLWSVR